MLTSGTKLGPYEIITPLGAGGMGEVYRARDSRLERDVAIKVLPASLSSDPNLRQRLDREAKAVSKLSHPHICTLHDIGHQDGVDFLVMELVEGETVEQRLVKGPLPPEQTVRYGAQIADALAKAHKLGITHRDLKPANIMLTKAGAKLMDFGLAKQFGSAPLAVALTEMTMEQSKLTGEGMLVGTFQYMAPEQLEGKEADPRTDIFALGEVLYEMATGKAAFRGTSRASLIAAIMTTEPSPMTQLQPLTPPALERVVRKCLEKDRDDRWQSAGDLASELRWIAEGGSQAGIASPVIKPRPLGKLPWVIAGIAIALAALAATLYIKKGSVPESTLRASILPEENTSPVVIGDYAGPVVISPDVRRLAYVASDASGRAFLWVREFDNLHAHPLPGTEGATFPFWSPNSQAIAFFASGKLKSVSIEGGTPNDIADAPGGRGGSWGSTGTIILAPDFVTGIYQVPATGGTLRKVTSLDKTKHDSHRWPYFLPDGQHFLYLAVTHENLRAPDSGIYFASLDGKEDRLLVHAFSNAAYAGGRLLFLRDSTLVSQEFDPVQGVLRGEPQKIAEDVQTDAGTWRAAFDVAGDDALAYVSGGAATFQAAWYGRDGKEQGVAGSQWTNMSYVRVSPDGSRLAEELGDTKSDIWIHDISRNVATRFTFSSEPRSAPAWSRDGKWISFSGLHQGHNNLYRKLASGMGEEELLIEGDNNPYTITDWSPDNRVVLYSYGDLSALGQIGVLPVEGERKPKIILPCNNICKEGHFSPDGRWIAYSSNESGRFEVYVVPYGVEGAGKWQISANGGSQAIWRRDGKEIFFISMEGAIMSVPVSLQAGTVQLGAVQQLFRPNNTVGIIGIVGSYDVAADGKRLIVLISPKGNATPITLVTNWSRDLKK